MSKRAYYSLVQRRRHAEKGLCRDCTDPAEPGRKSCKRHLAWAIKRKQNWRDRLKTLGANDSRFAIYFRDESPSEEVPF